MKYCILKIQLSSSKLHTEVLMFKNRAAKTKASTKRSYPMIEISFLQQKILKMASQTHISLLMRRYGPLTPVTSNLILPFNGAQKNVRIDNDNKQ